MYICDAHGKTLHILYHVSTVHTFQNMTLRDQKVEEK